MELTRQEREKMYDKDYCNYPSLDTYLLGGYRISILSKLSAGQFDYEHKNAIYVFDKSGIPYKIADVTVTNEPSANLEDIAKNVKNAQYLLNKALEVMYYIAYNENKIIKSKDYSKVLETFQNALETDNLKDFDLEKLANPKTLARSNENLKKLRNEDRKFAKIKIDDALSNVETPELVA